MLVKRFRFHLLAICAPALLVAACGGGGDGGHAPAGASAQPAFTSLNQTTNPPGPNIDVAAMDLFPFNRGDNLTFDRKVGGVSNGTVTRTITAPAGSTSLFIVDEVDSTEPGKTDRSVYVVSRMNNGDVSLQIQDPLGAEGTAPGILNIFPVLEEYVTPFFAVGTTRLFEAQGDMQADADADGKSDSFRFEYRQVFQGLETLNLLGAARQVAHPRNSFVLTIRHTTGRQDSVTTGTEDTYFAPHIGLVRRDSGAVVRDGTTLSAPVSIEATHGTVGGISYP